ncbi:MAG: hypothetical protein RJA70_3681 [Pseudomonadota bacterium]|jgi:hypothetical protein
MMKHESVTSLALHSVYLRRFSAPSTVRQAVAALLLGPLMAGCGSSHTVGPDAQSVDPEETEPIADERPLMDENSPNPPPPPNPCADGSCQRCGDQICLEGFFCDQKQGACGWLPGCASQLTCGCVREQLRSCTCEARLGGVYVTCP